MQAMGCGFTGYAFSMSNPPNPEPRPLSQPPVYAWGVGWAQGTHAPTHPPGSTRRTGPPGLSQRCGLWLPSCSKFCPTPTGRLFLNRCFFLGFQCCNHPNSGGPHPAAMGTKLRQRKAVGGEPVPHHAADS